MFRKGHCLSLKRSPFVLYFSIIYYLIVCFAKTYVLPFPPPMLILVVALSKESKSTLAIRCGFRDTNSSRAPGTCITSDFYGPMNVHRGTVVERIIPHSRMSPISVAM